VLQTVFNERLGIPFQLIDDFNAANLKHPIINYSKESIENAWNILPDSLLAESQIENKNNNYLKLTTLEHPKSDFDVFSAIFFHLSRYEEYLDTKKDKHLRFDFQNSVLFKNNALLIPVVDVWIAEIKSRLIEMGMDKNAFKNQVFSTQASIDIDSVFAYKGKGVIRFIGSISNAFLSLNFEELKKSISVVLMGYKDPNDNFDYQLATLNNKTCNYFIQVGKYGSFDKNVSPKNVEFKAIINQLLAGNHKIGIHPSYASFNKKEVIESEIQTLKHITQQDIKHSRQHFLRFSLPETYRILNELGIDEEHSMGYSQTPGFRAGTALPFQWFDLKNNKTTQLKIVPFVCMDVAYKNFQKMNHQECLEVSKSIKMTCKDLNIPFTFVFHNESLSEHRGWENWRKVFEYWLSEEN
jgi:hypothetical protein